MKYQARYKISIVKEGYVLIAAQDASEARSEAEKFIRNFPLVSSAMVPADVIITSVKESDE